MRVVIAGGGIAGLTAALALSRRGHSVTVFEQARRFDEVGAGIQISPNGLKVLDALGAGARISRHAFRPRAQELRLGRSGALIFSVPLRERAINRWGADYLHVHRADLMSGLAETLSEQAPQAIQLGRRIVAYQQNEQDVVAITEDGEQVPGDLLIGADGLHSIVRTQMFGSEKPRYTGHVAWRAVVPVSALGDEVPPETACVWVGARRHAVTYRLRGGSLINFVGVVERDAATDESWYATGPSEEALADFHRSHASLTRIIERAGRLGIWPLYDRTPLASWTQGRVALIGDACHPMLPFMAQGAAQAIEDAYILAREVSASPDTARGLATYEAMRKPRTARIQALAARNAGLFHRSNPVTQLGTYGPMWMAGRIMPEAIRRQNDWIYGHDVTQ